MVASYSSSRADWLSPGVTVRPQGHGTHKAWLTPSSVLHGGGKCNAAAAVKPAKQAGKPRIIPTAYMNIPPLVTWPDYQAKLMMQGVTRMSTPPTPPLKQPRNTRYQAGATPYLSRTFTG
jgi:hypothetical protein